ncbi:MAG: TerC family protein [Pirellulales bacterium]|nr:TerC family protein [Pirellulales bacterium]
MTLAEHWIAFSILVAVLLALDLFVFHRHDHTPSLRESVGWSVFWVTLALAFNGWIWYWFGAQRALDYLTGYVIEKSLSVDNIFVFAVIFRFFLVPLKYQYRILFWGILGAVVLRLIFILLGAALIGKFHWIVPIFGLFLIYTAVKLALHTGEDVHPEKNIVLRAARRFLPVSKGGHEQYGHAFFVREAGRRCITPIFLVLLVVESTDVLFAVDSVPAIFGITKDPFIIFTSNIFAILGLRALYFLLAGVIEMFRYLHYGLSAVLGFVGINMVADYLAELYGNLPESDHLIPTWAKLAVIALLLGISMSASIFADRREEKRGEGRGERGE